MEVQKLDKQILGRSKVTANKVVKLLKHDMKVLVKLKHVKDKLEFPKEGQFNTHCTGKNCKPILVWP